MKISELNLHKNPRIFNLNELSYRSYFIPFENREKCGEKRENSAFFTSLCGDWLFKYAKSAYDMQDFISENLYNCTNEILAGLGRMYVSDERFKNNIDKSGEGTADFVNSAIKYYIDK